MNSFNTAVTIVFIGMLMLLFGADKWNRYQDKKRIDKEIKKVTDRFRWM